LYFYENGTNWSSFVQKFSKRSSVSITLIGKSNVVAGTALGVLHLKDIPLNNQVLLNGINNFPNVKINSFDLPSNYPSGGISLALSTTLFNPSIGTVPIGDMALDLMVGETKLGSVFATGVTIVPGDNILQLTGYINPAAEDIDVASSFFSAYIQGIDTDVAVQVLFFFFHFFFFLHPLHLLTSPSFLSFFFFFLKKII